jgi:hypothetical protein
LGYAADGFPIYAGFGHAEPHNGQSPIKPLRSSWRLKKGTRPGGGQGPGGTYDGTFGADFEYVEGAGDLDAANGRETVTPDYPDGIYAYFITDSFPYIPRMLAGNPDPSFDHHPPAGGNGPGGRMGPGGPMGPGGGGMRGPGGGMPPPGGPGGQGPDGRRPPPWGQPRG